MLFLCTSFKQVDLHWQKKKKKQVGCEKIKYNNNKEGCKYLGK